MLTSRSVSSAICRTATRLWNTILCQVAVLVDSHAVHNTPGLQGPAQQGASGHSTIVQIVTTSLLAIAKLQAQRVLDSQASKFESLLLKVQQFSEKMNAKDVSNIFWKIGKIQVHSAMDGQAGK
jgi:hypothetical protein